MPVADLPIDYHAGEGAKTAWLLGVGRRLQLRGQSADLFLQGQEDRLHVGE